MEDGVTHRWVGRGVQARASDQRPRRRDAHLAPLLHALEQPAHCIRDWAEVDELVRACD